MSGTKPTAVKSMAAHEAVVAGLTHMPERTRPAQQE